MKTLYAHALKNITICIVFYTADKRGFEPLFTRNTPGLYH